MGAIPEADPEEPVETKPFKFVTGELNPTPIAWYQSTQLRPIANNLIAGMFNQFYEPFLATSRRGFPPPSLMTPGDGC